MPLNVIVLGPPGAGKGTQAERLARRLAIPKISTGDILREAVQAGTETGRCVQATMARGELVSDEVMTGIVRERLTQPAAERGFVLDGFPRTVAQAVALDAIMEGRGALIVVDILVPEAELMRRLQLRLICGECGATADGFAGAAVGGTSREAEHARCRRCGGLLVQRSDDDAAVVRDRLKVYHCQTALLIEFYRHRPTFRSVDGAQPPDCVAAAVAAAVEAARAAAIVAGGSRR
jgi:adenylate kinase